MNNITYIDAKDITISDRVVKDIILSNYIPISGGSNIGAIEISSTLAISRINNNTKLPGSIAYGLGSLAVGSEFNDSGSLAVGPESNAKSRTVKYVSIDDLNSNSIVWSSLNEYVLSTDGQLSTEVIDTVYCILGDLVHFSEQNGFIWRKYTGEVNSKFTVEDASVEQLNSMTHVQDNHYKLYRLTDSGQISSYLYGLSGMTITRTSSGKWCLLRARAISKGNGSFAQGTGIAYGENSFATGGSRAQSYQSFAHGGTTNFAFGRYSHAEGNSKTYGMCAHSEGIDTYSIGFGSHSEGNKTSAIGVESHSEGLNTIAYGEQSHAEGANTYASSKYSHAEGFETSAIGSITHTIGWRTLAVGQASFAEGSYTSAYGEYSHTEGTYTTTNAKYAHAEGVSSVASGYRSHAEGVATYALGDGTHTEGFNVSADGQGAHAAGFNTHAKGAGSYAAGQKTYAYGKFSEAIGYQTSAEGQYSRASGKLTRAIGSYTTAEGLSTVVFGDNSHADGRNVQLSAKSAYAWSGIETEYSIPNSRNGTFNINPIGGINGFYIGDRSLSTILSSYASDKFEPLLGQSFELSEFDTRDMLKLIITSLGGKLTLNGEEI